jgi:DNA-binding helix-hairpin-helix protein with protein kinase domain
MEVTLADGSRVQCEDSPFNQGAEGALFWSLGKSHVIKIYLHQEPHRRSTIENILGRFNLVREDPARGPFFGWPNALVVARNGKPALGIRMPTVGDARPLDCYVRPSYWQTLPAAEQGAWHARVSVAFRMSRILRWMHNRGLCHSDLSPKNFLVNIKSGQTSLIDCDGIVVPGLQPPSVLGTPQCMAPEIVMGKATPTVNTDKHALAVLIYWTLFLRHPLEGPKTYHHDPETDQRLAYGERALYIEHPADRSNRPVRLPFTSEMLTPQMRRLFQKAFVDGLHHPTKRPLAGDWESALVRMADRVVPCANLQCPMKSYVAAETPGFKCPWCGAPYRSPGGIVPILHLYHSGQRRGTYERDDWSVVGIHRITVHHADRRKSPDPGTPSSVVAHFENDAKGNWYLINDGLDDARLVEPAGSARFSRGQRVPVKSGLRLLMGSDPNLRAGAVEMVRTS